MNATRGKPKNIELVSVKREREQAMSYVTSQRDDVPDSLATGCTLDRRWHGDKLAVHDGQNE